MVAGLCLAAVLVQLPSTDFAAAAAVKHEADTRRTLGYLQWAFAPSWARGEHLNTSEQVHFSTTVQSFQQAHHMTSITSKSPSEYHEHVVVIIIINSNKDLFLGI